MRARAETNHIPAFLVLRSLNIGLVICFLTHFCGDFQYRTAVVLWKRACRSLGVGGTLSVRTTLMWREGKLVHTSAPSRGRSLGSRGENTPLSSTLCILLLSRWLLFCTVDSYRLFLTLLCIPLARKVVTLCSVPVPFWRAKPERTVETSLKAKDTATHYPELQSTCERYFTVSSLLELPNSTEIHETTK